jgi:hypothetical protein
MNVTKWFIVFIALSFASCSTKNIEITTEYIINENWGKQMSKPILVEKMWVKKDSLINPFSDLSQGEILSKLEEDSSFRWFANVNIGKNTEEIYRTKKIYFNKDNGFTWWVWNGANREKSILGNLETNTWYKFSGLVGYPYFVYIYVDSTNQVHRCDVNMANY